MNRRIFFTLPILIVIAVAAWVSWRKGVLQWPPAGSKDDTAEAPEAPMFPISSEELIAQALAAKEIDYETSLLYRVFALFGDPRLPQKYVTDVIDLDAGTALFSEIFAHKGQLSPAARITLVPFLARPNDPQSVLFTLRSMSAGISFLPRVAAAGKWRHLPAAGGLVQVWTNTDFHLAAPLQTSAHDVDKAWPKLRELIRPPTPDQAGNPSKDINPDSAIDVYIVPRANIDPREKGCAENLTGNACKIASVMGWTITTDPWIGKRSSSGYLIIDGSLRGDALLATLAHELFHASQDSYTNDQRWLAEATATWAEFRVMMKLGRTTSYETSYLYAFFPSLDSKALDLFQESRTHQYGAYLYFMFAQMERDDMVVSDIWAATNLADEAKGVDAVFPFKDHFRDFALRNWNREPVPKRYKTVDREFPNYHAPVHGSITLLPDHGHTLDQTVTSLTARYYKMEVDDKVAKLRVNLGEVAQNPYAGVDAIVTIDKKPPEVRRWTGQPDVTFCRDDPDDRVKSFVLIVSNASLQDDLTGKIELEPYSKPCKGTGATLNLNAGYTAEAKLQNKETTCEDHLTVTYKGSAHYTLLPVGTGTTNVDPNTLTTYPRAGFHSDRTGGFTVDVQGGGNCVNANGGGKRIWTYSTRYNAVPPNEFPSIGVRLRPGDYSVGYAFPEGAITAQGQILPGGRDFGFPGGRALGKGANPLDTQQRPKPVAPAPASITYQAEGPAMFPLAAVMQQSIEKVSAALHGTFTAYSKQFSGSNGVSNTFEMPPNNDGQTGTASLNLSYSLKVSRE
jgi:hypothetical protein